MAENKEYRILQNKYNTLLAKSQDLQEQLSTKNEQWAAMKQRYEVIEKNTRELCEMILAKDKNEMILGREYSWDSVKIEELLVKAKKVYHDYNNYRRDLMQKIFDESEKRGEIIAGLEDQISRMMQNGAQNVSMEEIYKQIEKDKKEDEIQKHAPVEMAKAVEEKKIQLSIDEDDDFEDASIFEKIAEKNEQMKPVPKKRPKLTPRAPIVKKDEKKHADAKLERRKNTSAYMVNLKEWESKIDEVMWLIIQIMGEQGKSSHVEIRNEVMVKNPSTSNTAITNALSSLRTYSVIASEKIVLPLSGQSIVSRLDTIGIRLYEMRFNKKPVKSEYETMIAEHTTATHGYGIKSVAEKMISAGMFTSVEYMNNRKNPVMIGEGITYIADIVARDQNGQTYYFEYELGHHTQKDFNAKCSKMIRVTDIINFIVPNNKVLNSITDQIEKWIVNKGPDALKNITIRVVSAIQIQDSLSENLKWKVVYEPGEKGTVATINF